MSKINDQPKPKFLFSANKQTKLSVQIQQKTSDLIEDYRTFHKEVSGEEVSLDTLISAFITSAMTSDKTFIKWRKEKDADVETKKIPEITLIPAKGEEELNLDIP